MSDDLVERVALIFARSAEDYVGDTRWIYLSNDEKADHLKKIWRGWESQARLAIAAIEAAGYVVVPREPTDMMLRVGVREYLSSWRATIDAARKKDKADVG